MNRQTVSVVIPALNAGRELEECLASLAKQTLLPQEIIVVDDCSDDGAAQEVCRRFPLVRLIRNSSRMGEDGSRNIGIKKAAGAYIATLDADTVVSERWLESLLAGITSGEDIGMCSSKIFMHGRPGIIDNVGHSLYYDFSAMHIGEGQADKGQFDTQREVFGFCIAGALIKKEVFQRTGYLDEDYQNNGKSVGEDEWVWRAHLEGFRCLFVPGAVMFHKRRNTRTVLQKKIVRQWERNRVLSLLKFYPLCALPAASYYTLKRLLVSWRAHRRCARRAAPLGSIVAGVACGWRDALLLAPLFLRKRKQLNYPARAGRARNLLARQWHSSADSIF